MTPETPLALTLSPLVGDTRGSAMTEYTILVGVVGIACMGAFIALGIALVNDFELVRSIVLQPY